MKTPSPWIATGIGVVGLLCGASSLFWNLYVYRHERPGFAIDCARDFDPPGWGTMGRGAPSGAYYVYDNRTHEVAVPCKVINVGQKAEVVRRIDSRLAVNDLAVPAADTDAVTIGGKSFQDVVFKYNFPWQNGANAATVRVSLITTGGTLSLEKPIVMYPFY